MTACLVCGARVAGQTGDRSRSSQTHLRLFADWLRTHEVDRDRYADLQGGLVAQGVWSSEYTLAKSAFVLETVIRAHAARGLEPVVGAL